MQLCNCGTVQGGGRGNFGTPAARLEPGITIGAAAGLGNSQWRKVRQMQPFRGKGSVELRLYNSDNPESRAVNALRLVCQRILVFFSIDFVSLISGIVTLLKCLWIFYCLLSFNSFRDR